MTLEQQVTSLEISKRLKELEVKQDGLFYWVEFEQDGDGPADSIERTHLFYSEDMQKGKWGHRGAWGDMDRGKGVDDIIFAFTVAEIGQYLHGEAIQFGNLSEGWIVNWTNFKGGVASIREINLANAMGKMLIYLLENKLI